MREHDVVEDAVATGRDALVAVDVDAVEGKFFSPVINDLQRAQRELVAILDQLTRRFQFLFFIDFLEQ